MRAGYHSGLSLKINEHRAATTPGRDLRLQIVAEEEGFEPPRPFRA